MNEKTPEEKSLSEVKKISFWVSQLIIIVATMCGVYLAADQGFKQAITFESIQSDKNNFYLRESLASELNDNLKIIKNFIVEAKKGGYKEPPLRLETFIWDSMKFSSATLETPSPLLREARMFHRKVNDIMTTEHFPRAIKIQKLEEIIQHMENNVLPAFKVNTDAIKAKLSQQNIPV